jgi:anaerobic magnesium-protoporphyrin IX monomethyl ester cyclase
MNIVLSTAPDENSRSWNEASFAPLGLLYVAAGVSNLADANVKILDVYAEGLNSKQSVERILSCSPDILGITVTSENLKESTEVLTGVKAARPSVVTIFGGIHPTLFDELLLREIPYLDFILRGEADFSFPEFCGRLLQGQDIAGLPGLSYRFENKIVRGDHQLIDDLDAIPIPDRSLLQRSLYGNQWYGVRLPGIGNRVTTAFSSRGCPFHCSFCAMTHFCKGRFRARSALNVFEELQRIAKEGFEFVVFWDDNFTANSARVHELCEMLIQSNLGLHFGFAGSLHLLPEPTLRLMQRAGFDLAFLGVESGSDAVLAAYDKPVRRENLAEAVSGAKQAHMFIVASFIAGASQETEQDFEATLDFVRQTRPHYSEITPLMVHPGSHLWDKINGPQMPPTLESSASRPIWRFPGQLDKEIIERRLKEFRKVFLETYTNGFRSKAKRLAEFIALLIHNRSIRHVLKAFIKDFNLIRQFVRMRHH